MKLTVYDSNNEKKVSVPRAIWGVPIVSMLGDGTTLRYGSKIVWKEGAEYAPAAESWDGTVEVIEKRIRILNSAKAHRKADSFIRAAKRAGVQVDEPQIRASLLARASL